YIVVDRGAHPAAHRAVFEPWFVGQIVVSGGDHDLLAQRPAQKCWQHGMMAREPAEDQIRSPSFTYHSPHNGRRPSKLYPVDLIVRSQKFIISGNKIRWTAIGYQQDPHAAFLHST